MTVGVLVVRRLPRRPAAALREAAHDRGDPAGDRRGRRRRFHDLVHAARRDAGRRHGEHRLARPRPLQRDRRRRPGRGEPRSTSAAAGTNSTSARSTPIPASTPRRTIRVYITVPFLAIEAPTLTVDQPAEGATYENGAIPVQGATTNADSVVVSATYTGPATGTKATDKATPVAAGDPCVGDGEGRRGRDVRHVLRADHGQVGDHSHGVQPRGQDHGHHPQRHGRVQGRQCRRRDQERPGMAEGLGRWQGVRQDHRGRARVRPGQHADVHRPRSRSRSGPASPAPRTSRSTAPTSGT